MRILLFLLMTMLINQVVFASTSYNCTHGGQAMSFQLDSKTHIIKFSNIDYFGAAQSLADYEFSAEMSNNMVQFNYDWYYTAEYKMVFLEDFTKHSQLENVEMLLTFNDYDGAWEDDVLMNCQIVPLR